MSNSILATISVDYFSDFSLFCISSQMNRMHVHVLLENLQIKQYGNHVYPGSLSLLYTMNLIQNLIVKRFVPFHNETAHN